MQIIETKSEGLSREYTVNLPANEIEEKVTDKLLEIQRTAQIPGFRPGKVPVPVLRKRFGQAILGEVLERAVGDSSKQALTEKGIRPAMQPEIEITTYEDGSDLEYKIAVETLPDIELTDLTKIKLERIVPQADPKDIDDALTNIAKSQGTSEPIKSDRKSKEGDIVIIDFLGTVDGKEFPGGKAEDYQLEIGSGSFIPGFEEQLTGLKPSVETNIEVTFPEDYGATDLAGKNATFQVTIKEIRQAIPAQIDDELAKKIGMDNLDALKDSISNEQSREYSSVARMRAKRLLLDNLFESHSFEVPAKMVEQEFDSILAQYEEKYKESREAPNPTEDPDAEDLNKDPKLDDEQKQEFRDIAERRVRLGLLLAEIGRQNDIQIGQEEINRAMMEEARKYPGQEQKVLEFYKDNPQALESVSAPLYEEKVIDFILELAKVDDKKVTVKEFMEILEKDNAEEQKKEKVPKKSPGKGTKGKKKITSKKESTKKSESKTK